MTAIIAGRVASLRNVTENLEDNVGSCRIQEIKKGVQKQRGKAKIGQYLSSPYQTIDHFVLANKKWLGKMK